MTRRRGIVAVALVASLLAGVSALAEPKPKAAPGPVSIEVKAQPIPAFDHHDADRKQFGVLAYRGGMVLTSPYREFGGFSALRVAPDGSNFIAINDRGWWMNGRITYDGRRPSGIADAVMAPVLASDGRPIQSRRWYDTEAVAQDGGTLYVALERVHRILRFDYGKDGLRARGQLIDVPPQMRKLPPNKGIEAMVVIPRGRPLGGTLVAMSEAGLDGASDHISFLIGGPSPGTFTIKRRDGFSITDAALLPKGDMLILERNFGWTTGLFIRVRRVVTDAIKPGAVLDGPVLFSADLGQQIDNMEGISVHERDGEVVITMISDDNFSILQRTLLLQFTLAEP